jgi:hypothetical protein
MLDTPTLGPADIRLRKLRHWAQISAAFAERAASMDGILVAQALLEGDIGPRIIPAVRRAGQRWTAPATSAWTVVKILHAYQESQAAAQLLGNIEEYGRMVGEAVQREADVLQARMEVALECQQPLPELQGVDCASEKALLAHRAALRAQLDAQFAVVSTLRGEARYTRRAAELMERYELRQAMGASASSAAGGGSSSGNASAASSGGVAAGGSSVQEDPDSDGFACGVCRSEAGGEGQHPALTPCAHLFCDGCINAWHRVKPICPSCRRPFTLAELLVVDPGLAGQEAASVSLESVYADGTGTGRGSAGTGAAAASAGAEGSAALAATASSASSSLHRSSSSGSGGTSASDHTATLAQYGVASMAAVNAIQLPSSLADYGSKVGAVCRRLQCLPAGDKAIIVSRFSRALDCAAAALGELGVGAVRLEGPPSKRADAVRVFNAARPEIVRAMLLNAEADCSGLTLVAANHMFLLEPVLGRSTLAQLIGRVSRMGQTKACVVYHLVATPTHEEALIANVAAHQHGHAGRGGGSRRGALEADGVPLRQALDILQGAAPAPGSSAAGVAADGAGDGAAGAAPGLRAMPSAASSSSAGDATVAASGSASGGGGGDAPLLQNEQEARSIMELDGEQKGQRRYDK